MSARRVGVVAAAAVLLAAASPAAAFVRSTTVSNDPTAEGSCLWWRNPTVTYKVNATGFAGNGCADGPDGAVALVKQSFTAWSGQPGSNFGFVYGGPSTTAALGNDGVNLVVFRRGFCRGANGAIAPGDPNNCWAHENAGSQVLTIALTTTTFRVDTGEILDADMELRSWSGTGTPLPIPPQGSTSDGWYFTCNDVVTKCARYGDSGCKFMDIGTTVTHEAGHVLGLDHVCIYPNAPASTCDFNAVMNATAGVGAINRSLAQDDKNGVAAIYPQGKAPDPQNGCLARPVVHGSGGCASGGAGGLGLVVLAGLALRRRLARG